MQAMIEKAMAEAGLDEVAQRVRRAEPLDEATLQQLARADVLLVSRLADAVRAQHHGDEVLLVDGDPAALGLDVVTVEPPLGGEEGATGQEALHRIALERLRTPGSRRVAVGWEALGLELAQTALLFGADTLYGRLAASRALPVVDGRGLGRREEIKGLVQRSGRDPRWHDETEATLEKRR